MTNREKIFQYYERQQAAKQISDARSAERVDPESEESDTYVFHRSGKEYLYRMGGLRNFVEYVKSLSSHRILDIGTGTGNAIKVVSDMQMFKGLDVEVTALNRNPELAQNFPKDKVHITGAETLRGIDPKSLGGVLALNSIAYSAYPKLAIQKIDEVLIPGGAIKGTFAVLGGIRNYSGSMFKDCAQFTRELQSRGYDVSYLPNHEFSGVKNFGDDEKEYCAVYWNSVVVAIKPGNPNAPSARTLIDSDLAEVQKFKVKHESGREIYVLDD